ncbi:MAG: hypothetical protein OWU33_15735 [Firmicutes bacterium]|nr:hypothetical protein [Bacillota bacterium]
MPTNSRRVKHIGDNAYRESYRYLLKKELLGQHQWITRPDTQHAILIQHGNR